MPRREKRNSVDLICLREFIYDIQIWCATTNKQHEHVKREQKTIEESAKQQLSFVIAILHVYTHC